MSLPELCKCGNKATGWMCSYTEDVPYCKDCDPDPDIDESHICYACGKPSHRSSYIGSGIYLGVCSKCDTGEPLGYEHLGYGYLGESDANGEVCGGR